MDILILHQKQTPVLYHKIVGRIEVYLAGDDNLARVEKRCGGEEVFMRATGDRP